MFASPFEYCPHCGQCVLLDQTQPQCAAEQQCKILLCPFDKYFTGKEMESASAGPRRRPVAKPG